MVSSRKYYGLFYLKYFEYAIQCSLGSSISPMIDKSFLDKHFLRAYDKYKSKTYKTME